MQQGNLAFSRGDYKNALSYYLKAKEGIRDDARPLADLYGNIGNVYGILGKIDQAVICYKKAMEILRRIEDYGRLGITYTNIGNLYSDKEDADQAIHYYKQAALLLEESRKFGELSMLYGNISLLLRKQSDYKSALEYAEKGMSLAKKCRTPQYLADALHRLAKAKEGIGDIAEAQRISERAYLLYEQMKDELGCAATRYHQVALHEKEQNLEAAIQCLKEVVTIDVKFQLPKLQQNKTRLKKLQNKRRK